MADLKTNLLGFVMNSPVIGASGTVGYGVEYEELADFAKIGGISGKGLTLHGHHYLAAMPRDFSVAAAHLNHGQRPTAGRDVAFVEEL